MPEFTVAEATESADLIPEDLLEFKVPRMDQGLVRSPRWELNGLSATRSLDGNDFDALNAGHMSFAYTEIAPGALLEPYWMDNADEMVYVVAGDHLSVWRMGKGDRSDGDTDYFTVRQVGIFLDSPPP